MTTTPTDRPRIGIADMSRAQRLALLRTVAEAAATAGIPIGDSDGPMQLALRHDPRFNPSPHVEAMNTTLTGILGQPGSRVMIFTPPQIGKSLMTRWFVFWWLTMHPAHQIILASYATSLAVTHGAAVRELVRMYGDRYGLNLSQTESTKAAWRVRTGGALRSAGVRKGISGIPMHLGVIDDPFAGRAEAESPVMRAAVWDWYSSVFSARRAPGTSELLVNTRWHADDLAGRLLDQDGRVEEGGAWTVLHMPAIALAPDAEKHIYADPLGREPGAPLTHPSILPDDPASWAGADSYGAALLGHWADQRARATNRDWNSLYQGMPFDAEGALLTAEDVRAATDAPPTEFKRVAVGIDPSGGGRDTAGVVAAGLDGAGRVWWLEDRTERASAFVWPRTACLLAHKHGADRIIYEKNFGGDQAEPLITQAWAELIREGAVDGLCPLVTGVVASKSKVLRAEPIAQAVKTGRAWFARGADLKQLTTEWQMWEPGSSWSPGALDAGVHVATHLLPALPRGATVSNPVGRRRDEARVTGINARRIG